MGCSNVMWTRNTHFVRILCRQFLNISIYIFPLNGIVATAIDVLCNYKFEYIQFVQIGSGVVAIELILTSNVWNTKAIAVVATYY